MKEEIWLSLDDLIAQREARRAQERAEEKEARLSKQEEAKQYAAALEAYQLTAEDKDAIMRKIAKAFADGEKELLLFDFPSALCNDDGRRINNSIEGWEATLPGAARRVFEFWRDDLQPRGFRFFARIINYPEGMPGDVGIFVSWPKELEE
jgi:hypothetical protein